MKLYLGQKSPSGPNIAVKILQVSISIMDTADQFVWPRTRDGQYIVKSDYYTAKNINTRLPPNPASSNVQN